MKAVCVSVMPNEAESSSYVTVIDYKGTQSLAFFLCGVVVCVVCVLFVYRDERLVFVADGVSLR